MQAVVAEDNMEIIIYLVEEKDRNAFSTSYIPSGEARQLDRRPVPAGPTIII